MESPILFFLLIIISTVSGNYWDFDSYNENKVSLAGRTLRVFDAEDSNYIKQKHLVALDIRLTRKSILHYYLCSASVITSQWILTAAHCFVKNYKLTDMYAYVRRIEDFQWVQLGEVSKENIIVHPGYIHTPDDPQPENDIAVIKTTRRMPLSENLVPIKLEDRPVGKCQKAIMTGYGETELGEYMLDKPREGLVSVNSCPIYGKNVICSLNVVRAGGGDSGGSVISMRGRLLGVISCGCRDVYVQKLCMSIYVDVSQYLDWIHGHIGSETESESGITE